MVFDKEEQPLVSIIVPSYNHAQYITQCIESIMQQTYKNFELIVIDDGSKDNTKVVLESLQLKYKFTAVFQNNHGIAFTLNRGIKEFSTGKYLTFCASDDYWTLDKLEKQVQFMEDNQFYPMCYGKTHYVNEASDVLFQYDFKNKGLKGGLLFEDIFLFKIHPPVNYLFRKSIFDEVGYYDENIFAEDYYMNLKISSRYPIGFIDEYLCFYRYTDMGFKIVRSKMVSDSHLISIEDYREHPLYNTAKSSVYLRNFNTFSGFSNHKKEALLNLIKSLHLFYKRSFITGVLKVLCIWKNVDHFEMK